MLISNKKNITEFLQRYASHPNYQSPTGTHLHARSWQTEAPLRMLLNNLNKEVAEDPEHLIVYGGTGKAARSKEDVKKIIQELLVLDKDHSLLIQSGRAQGTIRSHENAPRVLIANSNLVPAWATWEHFNHLQEKDLIMFGQMTAGSWIYIGSQGILQGTFETLASLARKHFAGSLKGRLVVTGGLGGMGGAQGLAVTLNHGVCLAAEIDPERIKKRLNSGYLDQMTADYKQAIAWALQAKNSGSPLSIGYVGHIQTLLENLIKDGITPDIATDQTSAHDPINGYIPTCYTLKEAIEQRKQDPATYQKRSIASMAKHVGLLLQMQAQGTICFDYGNNIRQWAKESGESNAFSIPGFVPEYIRPLFCQGKGPFRWVALSGNPEDIYTTDQALIKAFPEDTHLHHWLKAAREKISFQGLPSRICWLGMGEREKAGLIFNELVRTNQVSAPLVIGRDHLDCGSVASPNRETEGMKDGSDAISDWPLLNLMANTAGGATWVSFHHGGGVGMGFSQHAGMVIVCDGTKQADSRLRSVLYNDPYLGIARHADAGYSEAIKQQESL